MINEHNGHVELRKEIYNNMGCELEKKFVQYCIALM